MPRLHQGVGNERRRHEDSIVSNRTIVITGASDGIGAAAAQRLNEDGNDVVIVGRSPKKTTEVARALNVAHYVADFASLEDVRVLTAKLRADYPRIDVLVNNAGGVMGERTLTIDGNELTTQVNYLAPFLLTNLLLDILSDSVATVIATSSLANRFAGTVDLDDFTLAHRYTPMRAYGRAKLMDILFTRELNRRYHQVGISAAAFHPGTVRTSFSAEYGGAVSFVYRSFTKHLLRTPAQGAETLVWLATSRPGRDWVSGEFYKDKTIMKATRQAYDPILANDLWELSATLTAIT